MLSHATDASGRGATEGEGRPPADEAVQWACGALLGSGSGPWTAGVAPPASAAGDMATVALFLHLRCGLARVAALSLTAGEVSARRGLTPASTKKNRSEARAILEFGLGDLSPGSMPSAEAPLDLLRAIVARVRGLRMADIRKLRSSRLGGAKGGRPVSRTMRVLEMVRRLRARAGADHLSAQEFEAIRMELAR